MTRSGLASSIAAALVLAVPAPAAQLTPIVAERYVAFSDVVLGTQQRVDASGFDPFSAELGAGEVLQTSTLETDRISARLSHQVLASPAAGPGDADDHFVADSSFSITFSLDEASPFELDLRIAEFEAVSDVAEIFSWWDLQIVLFATLSGPSGELAALRFDLQEDCAFQEICALDESLFSTGVLDPGAYTLVARAFAEVEADLICVGIGCSSQTKLPSSSDALVDLELRLVPEPGTLLLLAPGLLGLACLGARHAPRG